METPAASDNNGINVHVKNVVDDIFGPVIFPVIMGVAETVERNPIKINEVIQPIGDTGVIPVGVTGFKRMPR